MKNLQILKAILLMVEVLSYSSSYKAVLIEELNRMIEREKKDLIQNQNKLVKKTKFNLCN